MDKTAEVIAGMLTENTGSHMLDSGGAYGRNWERNQGHKFEDDPEATYDLSEYGTGITINLYHWLNSRVEYAEELDKRFQEFAKGMPDDPWAEIMEKFTEEIGAEGKYNVNSYNGDCLLSQVIQYVVIEDADGDEYAFLQIHGGCDVRGGYTAPRVFKIGEEFSLHDNARAVFYCLNDEGSHMWDTDDAGGHWYAANDEMELEVDKLKVREDGKAECPVCGSEMGAGF